MDEEKVIELYVNQRYTMRRIADIMGTNHHRIKDVLNRHNIKVTTTNRKGKPLSQDSRRAMSLSRKKAISEGRIVPYNKGLKSSRKQNIENMVGHIKYDVDYDFYNQFENLDKIKCLNKMLVRPRVYKNFDTKLYKLFIIKFYYDKQFNVVYSRWVKMDKNRWAAPSLDHKKPLSAGGTYDLDNLQILSWFENRAKCDMDIETWKKFKKMTKTNSNLYID